MKDIKNLLIILLSIGLVGTWVYHLYDKTVYSNKRTEIYIKDSIAVAQGVRDSLQKIYSATISELDTKLDSTQTNADSLKMQLNSKLGEIYKLKSEISGILKNKGATGADMQKAQVKIKELQLLVQSLLEEKTNMEEEKKRLSGIMAQLSGEVTDLQETMKKLDQENKSLSEKVQLASVFVASEINFIPTAVRSGREQENSNVKKVKKFVVSFAVQNNVNQYSSAYVYIVVTQPDGKVIRNGEILESATMETHNGQKLPYTRSVRFEYQKGEVKRLLFSVDPDKFQKGIYTLQIYHNGYMIGQSVKKLL